MNKMDSDEFRSRIFALNNARKIFGELTEKNITKAFEAYQKILAERPREYFLISKKAGRRMRTMIDDYIRPRCDECGAELRLFHVNEKPGSKQNRLGWGSVWFCEECGFNKLSKKTVVEWMQTLERKNYPTGGLRWHMEMLLRSFLRRLYTGSQERIEKLQGQKQLSELTT